MAGIYVHIPFCKQFCYYCDFYKSANYKYVAPFMDSILHEIDLRSAFTDEIIDTIYFGGGTPSSISIDRIALILNKIFSVFPVSKTVSISIELNPDDLDFSYFLTLKDIGFSRLSIGIQSFDDKILNFLHRSHNAKQALACIKEAKLAGFSDISIDLIYGIPNQSLQHLANDLQTFYEFDIKHLSAYHLGIEQGTQFGRMVKKGTLTAINEKDSEKFYRLLTKSLSDNFFEHYEISNFAKDGFYSKHNRAYWNNSIYLGFGPGAHSYNKVFRFWNVSSIKKYVDCLKNDIIWFEKEELTEQDKYNEYILTGLRTQWGCSFSKIKSRFGLKTYEYCLRIVDKFKKDNIVRIVDDSFILNEQYFLQADYYISQFIQL